MSQASQKTTTPLDAIKTLASYRLRWLVPTVLLTVAGLGYAVLREPEWEASQPLLIRDEAASGLSRPGEFDSADDMKAAQETVLELARSRSLVAAALTEIGPPDDYRKPEHWPTKRDVEKAQGRIELAPPRGAEFGRTEVFYLTVKDKYAKRAVALAQAVCDQVDARIRELRDRKAQSLVNELTITVNLAQTDLDDATARLSQVEQEVGDDLAELRILSESAAGQSNLRQTLIQLKNEHRQALTVQRTHEQLMEMLQVARQDPDRLAATPNQLLETQSALRQLKDGLVNAQLLTARLLGEMTEAHPRVQAAMAAQDHIRRRLHGELETAVGSLRAELQLSSRRVEAIEGQLAEVTGRMNKLAAFRATYSNLDDEVRRRSETLKQAEQDLSSARASHAAALSASLLTRLDDPTTGNDPMGPRKAAIVLTGLVSGLLAGWGVVFLTVPGVIPAPAGAATGRSHSNQSLSPSRRPTAAERGLSLKEALRRIAESVPSRN